jgi:hypothetical protein
LQFCVDVRIDSVTIRTVGSLLPRKSRQARTVSFRVWTYGQKGR